MTYLHYIHGAHLIVEIFSERLNREVHYEDFCAFGQEPDKFIRPVNLFDNIKGLKNVGNYQSFALTAYFLILDAQSKAADENPMAFKPLIENPKSLSEAILYDRCIQKVEELRSCVMNVKAEMNASKPYRLFSAAQKAITDSRKESMEGVSVPNAAEVLPIYFSHEQVQAVETEILECAKMHIECIQVQTRL